MRPVLRHFLGGHSPREAGGVFLALASIFAAMAAAVGGAIHLAGVDMRAPPEWATQIVFIAALALSAASLWFFTGGVASLVRQPRAFGRDELVVAILIAALAGSWSGRAALLIAEGHPAADALGFTAARGLWAVRVDGAALRVAGDITPRLAERIEDELALDPDIEILAIDSPGGRLDSALRIAHSVRERGLDVHVASACASACLTVLLAGRLRIVSPSASLGCHQPSHALTGEAVGPFGAFPEHSPPPDGAATHREIVAACNRTPPEAMHFLSLADMAEIGAITHIGRDRSSAEEAVAFCARRPFACARTAR